MDGTVYPEAKQVARSEQACVMKKNNNLDHMTISSPSEPARRPEEAVLRAAGPAPSPGRGPRPAAGRTQRALRETAANQRGGSLPTERYRCLSCIGQIQCSFL